jgi:cytochrome c2
MNTHRSAKQRVMRSVAKFCAHSALLVLSASVVAQDEAAKGKQLFDAQCVACHTVKPGQNGFGPSLAGVVGRHAGTASGFNYTSAMANSGLTWDDSALDAFLASTTQKVPGTAMALALPSPGDRAAIIAYLKTISPAATAGAAPATAAAPAPVPHGGPTQRELTHAASGTRDWLYASKD